jgi:protein-disulfide isomerase
MTDPRQAGSNKSRARDKTAQMRAERAAAAARQQRNQRILTILGGVVVFGLIAAIVWAVVTSGPEPTKPRSTGDAVPANVDGHSIPTGDKDAPVELDLYVDYMCPACGGFEQVNGADLSEFLDNGTIKLDIHILNFLDGTSEGTQYSTRAGNAVATVANKSPEHVWDFHKALFENQPSEGTTGLSDAKLVEIATGVGVPDEVADTFADGTYDKWIVDSNKAAGDDGVDGTPTLFINGEEFAGDWAEPGQVRAAIEAAAKAG